MANSDSTFGISLFVVSIIAIICNFVSILVKLCREFTNPKLWKYSLLYQDFAHLVLAVGLLLFCVNLFNENPKLCDASGFFLLFGIVQSLFSFLTTGVILLSIQNPGKSTSLSTFHRNIVAIIITPGVILGALLSALPYIAGDLFSRKAEVDVTCFQVRDHGQEGSTYGTLIVAIWWLLLTATAICDVILVLKLWKFNNRINSAQNNVWQSQLVSQGKRLVQITIFGHFVFICILLLITVSIYAEVKTLKESNTWIVMTSLVVAAIVHGVVSNVSDVMWTSCCCPSRSTVKEPHRKLKKLELIKIEDQGKIRMKATWNIGKHATKRGLMKVYGVNHLKSWAQEIVMLGMLRRAQHPSLLQCLWTNSSNPYYETMTLISGEIITSDSRIICLELTNGGTLHDFLQKAELPLPEPCQRMIIHDVAEGLFYLHHENILHNNLTSSCIYLKGSLQTRSYKHRKSMVLRAAVGDFEDAHIYGTLQQSLDNSIKDKRYFYLPDIRSFALIALEVVSKMCEKKFQNRYVNYNSEHVPLKLNLANVISDEDDEFEAQYCYDVPETNGLFETDIPDETGSSDERCSSPDLMPHFRRQDSMENVMDKNRPLSPPVYNGPSRMDAKTPETLYNYDMSESEDDTEVASLAFKTKKSPPPRPMSPKIKLNGNTHATPERCKSPIVSKTKSEKASKRKSRKDLSKSMDSSVVVRARKAPHSRSLSPSQYDKQIEHVPRCTSPDPMNDEKLQELRKETQENTKLNSGRKEKKFALNRKKSDENLNSGQKNGKAFEAFVSASDEKKRKDGNWLSKPTSILKSITSNDTTVSVFKAKQNDEDSHLDAIDEEVVYSTQGSRNKPRAPKQKPKPEVWDIIDEQYYTQVNKKAMHKLKKTVSGESRSSLWSFISTPEDLDDDDLDDILECLPGMTDPADLRRSEITVSEIMAEKQNAEKKCAERKRFSHKDLPHSKFELIDYYEMLKSKEITMNDVPEDKREMLLNVVEMKREERLKRDRQFSGAGAIRNDEMYDNGMNPGGLNINSNGKIKVVSFRKNQSNSSPNTSPYQSQTTERDPRLERARSAPLKRPRTPMHKPPVEKTPEVNPALSINSSISNSNKRTRARSALKRAINNKNQHVVKNDRGRAIQGEKQDLTLKYATVRKINVSSALNDKCEDEMTDETLVVPVPTSESFSLTKPKSVDIKRFPSFSSNESASSFASSVRLRKADVSLTSGEMSSLSSQAESDHFETDGHMTDIEGPLKTQMSNKRKFGPGPPSRVDSGFDSGSVSSEMSDAVLNRAKQFTVGGSVHHTNQIHTKGGIGSWARNYKMVDAIPNSPYSFSNKFLPPVSSLPEESIASGSTSSIDRPLSANRNSHTGHMSPTSNDNQRTIQSGPSPRVIEVNTSNNKGTLNLTNRTLPDNRPMSPERTMSPNRPMSPLNRPMSPNVQPTDNRPKARPKLKTRPFSPPINKSTKKMPKSLSPSSSRSSSKEDLLSQTDSIKSYSQQTRHRSLSPNYNSNGHVLANRTTVKSPTPCITVDSEADSKTVSKATKRYRELVKQGVPMRTSVIDASPTRAQAVSQESGDTRPTSRPGTAESYHENAMDDQELYADLESKGFFASRSRSPSPSKGTTPTRGRSPKASHSSPSNKKERDIKRKRNKGIPLDQIVREKPDNETYVNGKPRTAHRSRSKNHLAVTEEAYLNQPTSEDSETCSIKTNKSNISTPSGSKPKVMIDAELVIDRVFSQNNQQGYELDVEVEAALGLDKDPFKQLNDMHSCDTKMDTTNLDNIALLQGVSQKHIHGCIELASSLHVVTVRDLLPATKPTFEILRNKLQQVGQLGPVGNQLLDIIHDCWLSDMPPTSGQLVEQLTDPVTETEV